MKLFFVSIIFIVISGCSSFSSQKVKVSKVLFDIVATTNTMYGKNSVLCSNAKGRVNVLHNKIVGTIVDSYGRKYAVSGIIDDDGKISGGFAVTAVTVVEFTGVLSEDHKKLTGSWKDMYDCSGTWSSQEIHQYEIPNTIKRRSKIEPSVLARSFSA